MLNYFLSNSDSLNNSTLDQNTKVNLYFNINLDLVHKLTIIGFIVVLLCITSFLSRILIKHKSLFLDRNKTISILLSIIGFLFFGLALKSFAYILDSIVMKSVFIGLTSVVVLLLINSVAFKVLNMKQLTIKYIISFSICILVYIVVNEYCILSCLQGYIEAFSVTFCLCYSYTAKSWFFVKHILFIEGTGGSPASSSRPSISNLPNPTGAGDAGEPDPSFTPRNNLTVQQTNKVLAGYLDPNYSHFN